MSKRILITGIAGSIGSELARQLHKKNKVYGVDINETGLFNIIGELSISGRVGDIRDEATVKEIFSDFKPQIVYHAAAYKHVTPMEWHPLEAIKANIIGTYNVVQYSKIYPVEKFVFISTDKAVQSASIMGATKRVGEIIVKNQGKGYVVVRFANVLGSRGSVIPIWEGQINRGEDITVTDPDMTRYFMSVKEACNLVIKGGEMGKGGEIIVLDMGKPVRIKDLAQEIVDKLGGKIKYIGVREGEAMQEKLMLEEEEKVAVKKGSFYIIK